MRVPAPPARPWELNQAEVDLVKNHICKGATDKELEWCLTMARRVKLDPIRGQIFFVPFKDDTIPQGKKWIPIVGINGLLHIAARDHADFGSIEEPEFGPLHDVPWTYYQKTGTIKNCPEWARVRVWKKGFDKPTTATVYFAEIYPYPGGSDMVKRMPKLMLGKVATAHAIRRAWPATDGLYIREEFQEPPQFTDNGRAIVYPDAPIETPALDENAAHGHAPGSEKAKQAEATLAKVEAEDRKLKEQRAQKIPGSNPGREAAHVGEQGKPPDGLNPSAATKYALEVDITNPEDPIVRGDVGEVLPTLEKFIKATWGKDEFWHIRPADVATIHAAGKELHFQVTEFSANAGKGAVQGEATTGAQTKAAPQSKKGEPKSFAKEGAGLATGAHPTVLKGTIARCIAGMTGKNNPLRQVTITLPDNKKPTLGCFDSKLFPHLDKAIGKEVEVFVEERGKYLNLVGIRRIAGTEFEDNVPVIQNSQREAGGRTLF